MGTHGLLDEGDQSGTHGRPAKGQVLGRTGLGSLRKKHDQSRTCVTTVLHTRGGHKSRPGATSCIESSSHSRIREAQATLYRGCSKNVQRAAPTLRIALQYSSVSSHPPLCAPVSTSSCLFDITTMPPPIVVIALSSGLSSPIPPHARFDFSHVLQLLLGVFSRVKRSSARFDSLGLGSWTDWAAEARQAAWAIDCGDVLRLWVSISRETGGGESNVLGNRRGPSLGCIEVLRRTANVVLVGSMLYTRLLTPILGGR